MRSLPARSVSRHLVALTGLLLLSARPAAAADDDAPKGPAVTVLKVAKSCFSDIVAGTGTIIAREASSVRPERLGLSVTEVLAEEGLTTTAGQVLARLALADGGTLLVTAPLAGGVAETAGHAGHHPPPHAAA